MTSPYLDPRALTGTGLNALIAANLRKLATSDDVSDAVRVLELCRAESRRRAANKP